MDGNESLKCMVEVFFTLGEPPMALCALVEHPMGVRLVENSPLRLDKTILEQRPYMLRNRVDFRWDKDRGVVWSPVHPGIEFARSREELESTPVGQDVLRLSRGSGSI